jgi:hypothetical protein
VNATVVGTPVWSATKNVGIPNGLTVFSGTSTPASTCLEPGTSGAPAFQFALAADGVNVGVTSVTLTASGTLDDATEVAAVSLYRDVNSNGLFESGTDTLLGAPGTYSLDDGTVTFSGLSQTVPAGGSDLWLVVYDIQPGATVGGTFSVGIATTADVAVLGGPPLPPVIGPPIQGNEMVVGYVGSLTVASGPNNPAAAAVVGGSTGVELLHLALTASADEAIHISSLEVQLTGNLPPSSISLFLYADANGDSAFDGGDTFLAGPAGTVPGIGVHLAWFFSETIPPAGSVTWFVVAEISATAGPGNTTGVTLSNGDDIVARGSISSAAIPADGAPVVGETMTVEAPPGSGGSVTHRGGCGGHASFTSAAGTGLALLFLAFTLFLSFMKGWSWRSGA